MTVIEVIYYQAVCDACDVNLTERNDEYSAYGDDGSPGENVEDNGGYFITRGKGNPMTVVCAACVGMYVDTCSDAECDELTDHTPIAEAAITEWAASQLRTAKAAV